MIAVLIFVFLFGNITGMVVGHVLSKHNTNPVGALRIDKSDPDDGPYLFLELKTHPSIIEQQKYITLEVNTESYISQK